MTEIVFVLMLIISPRDQHAVQYFSSDQSCINVRDYYNHVRVGPGSFKCFIGTRKDNKV